MKARIFSDFWKDDNYDVTDKVVDVFYCENGEFKNMNISFRTNDGMLQTDENGKWIKPNIRVNMCQLRNRIWELLKLDLPCFDDVFDNHYLITMRNDYRDEQFINLAEIW